MNESVGTEVEGEREEGDKLNPKVIAFDMLYGAVKGLSGLFFKAFIARNTHGFSLIIHNSAVHSKFSTYFTRD